MVSFMLNAATGDFFTAMLTLAESEQPKAEVAVRVRVKGFPKNSEDSEGNGIVAFVGVSV